MHLLIVHYHLRPGGVRRVIELGAPPLARALGRRVSGVVLAAEAAPDEAWGRVITAALAPLPVETRIEPALGYVAESRLTPAARTRRLRRFFHAIFRDPARRPWAVWCHNAGLGRNLALNRELAAACSAHGVPLVFHHHDWWFDNRWQRWAEMRRTGFRTLAAVARAILPHGDVIRHAAINQTDARVLTRHFGPRAGWLPNLADAAPRPSAARARGARRWLAERLGDRAPVWLVPCRLLRRKNLAEALLLTRWLRPEAWLVTTGGASSADEEEYARHLAAAATAGGWRLRLAVLANGETDKPTVPELLAASEAVLLTSVQEGFGLPYLEATAAGRPLLARSLPNIAPDLARFGFRFPQQYSEVFVDPALLDGAAERARQRARYEHWRSHLPRSCRRAALRPPLLAARAWERPVPFSRLTFAGQLEVLRRPPEESWRRCAPLNEHLPAWRERAARGRLAVSDWPLQAGAWLEGHAYAARWLQLVEGRGPPAPGGAHRGEAAQAEFIDLKLQPENLYPLTWTREP